MKHALMRIFALSALSVFLSFGVFAVPFTFAQTSGGGDTVQNPNTQQGQTTQHVTVRLDNPIAVNSIPEFVEKVLRIVLKIGTPIVALAIIYTGYLFIAAQGKPEEITKAKKSLMYTLIGALILLGAYVIAETVVGTVAAIRGK